MHHQVSIALMGLPFASDKVHTADFYIDIGRRLLESDVPINSICLKDASGTTDPKTIYDTAVGLRKLMPPEMLLWMHTHDTASTAVACYMAAIQGGADGVDLSVRPMASGTVQPDVRSLAHALKGTGYSLDIDVVRMTEIENMLGELMQEYAFNPTTTTPDPRVICFPMPGGAIGPNVHMMVKAGILDRYSEVLEEFPVVVEAGGAWTSVTPGSQQYWLQAFNNVLHGRWKKIDPGFGKSVLGYFGRTPLPPDSEVVKIASQQLDMPVFEGDPLEAAPKNIEPARKALEERGLPVSEKNIFLVLAAMVPGKKMELNEGIRLLSGKARIDIPLKKKEEPEPKAAPQPAAPAALTGPLTTTCTVTENNVSRKFTVTVEPIGAAVGTEPSPNPGATPSAALGTPVHSTFAGSVDVTDIKVKAGDVVSQGQVVANVEAMKAQHDILAPVAGRVEAVHVAIGDEIDSSKPILTIA
jgi:pyruvate carboxylase subunit B